MREIKEWVQFTTSIVALIGAILALIASCVNFISNRRQETQLHQQDERLDRLESCLGEAAVSIEWPQRGDHVTGTNVDVVGANTMHDKCRYVFIVVRDVSRPGQAWRITDMIQVQTNGKWAAKAWLTEIAPGDEVDIDARGTSVSTLYGIRDTFTVPPTKGARSNIVRVRRMQ